MENIDFKNKPSETDKKLARQIVGRMLQAYKIEDPRELALKLDCTHGAIKNWGSAGRVPMDKLYHCHTDTGISLDWLVHGMPPVMVFDVARVEHFTKHLNSELASAVRYRLIEEAREDGIDSLASGISESVIKWLGVAVVESFDLPYKPEKKK
jgi:hypothetical protein